MRIAEAFAIVALFAGPALAVPPANLASETSPADIAAGSNLFTISCSSSYCHGVAGAGGRGPSLQNWTFPPDFVRMTVLQGRQGTPMPSFKANFSPAELSQLLAYVRSLSPDSEAGAADAIPQGEVTLSKQAALGSDIFFDQTRPAQCASCHSLRGNGGPVGPDLASLAAKTPRDLYQAMAHPKAGDPAFPAISVMTTDGTSFTGVKRDERHDTVRFYDLSSVPPVMRTFGKSEIAKIEALDKSAPYRHDLSQYSKDDLLALIALLKAGASDAPAELRLEDIGPL